jgi:NAD(P)-dependent dehydrogenase (short-subunit alcohol dehydrogenase family)
VVVTGASTGLGRAIGVEVASRGAAAAVVNYTRHASEAEESASLVRAQGAEAVVVQADVADDADNRPGARACAQDPGERQLPGLYRYSLVAGWHR